jgi:hypothetical protein
VPLSDGIAGSSDICSTQPPGQTTSAGIPLGARNDDFIQIRNIDNAKVVARKLLGLLSHLPRGRPPRRTTAEAKANRQSKPEASTQKEPTPNAQPTVENQR